MTCPVCTVRGRVREPGPSMVRYAAMTWCMSARGHGVHDVMRALNVQLRRGGPSPILPAVPRSSLDLALAPATPLPLLHSIRPPAVPILLLTRAVGGSTNASILNLEGNRVRREAFVPMPIAGAVADVAVVDHSQSRNRVTSAISPSFLLRRAGVPLVIPSINLDGSNTRDGITLPLLHLLRAPIDAGAGVYDDVGGSRPFAA